MNGWSLAALDMDRQDYQCYLGGSSRDKAICGIKVGSLTELFPVEIHSGRFTGQINTLKT